MVKFNQSLAMSLIALMLTSKAVSQMSEPYSNVETKIEALLEANVNSLSPFSGSVLVAQNGEIVYKGAFGLADLKEGTKNTIDSKSLLSDKNTEPNGIAIFSSKRGLISC